MTSCRRSATWTAVVLVGALMAPQYALAHPFHLSDATLDVSIAELLLHTLPAGAFEAALLIGAVLSLPAFFVIFWRSSLPSAPRVSTPLAEPVKPDAADDAAHDVAKKSSSVLIVPLLLTLPLFHSGCGGGGGDSGSSGGLHRTTDTAVRILHAGLDFEPVDLRVGDQYLSHAAFLETNFYAAIGNGPQTLTLERAHSPGVVVNQTQAVLKDKTGYALLISGQVSKGTLQVTLLEEPLARPDSGQGRVKLVNLLENAGTIAAAGGGVALGPTPFRSASDYATLVAGPQTFTIKNSRGGTLAVTTIDVPDRGDATIVLGGDSNQGVIIERTFQSLS